ACAWREGPEPSLPEPTRAGFEGPSDGASGAPLFASSRTCAHAGGCPPGRFRVPLAGRYSTAGAGLPDTTMLVLRVHEPGRSAHRMLDPVDRSFNSSVAGRARAGTSPPTGRADPERARSARPSAAPAR